MALFFAAFTVAASAETLRDYAHRAVLLKWHSEAEWQAFDEIVTPESGWDPCAVNPSRHDCEYTGPSSCGLGQFQPCPSSIAGNLWDTQRRQVWMTIHYIAERYGDPLNALVFRRVHNWY